MTLSSVGQLLGFLGPVVIMVTTGNTKLGAVHSFAPPCWAHYVGWMAVSLGFLFQLIGWAKKKRRCSLHETFYQVVNQSQTERKNYHRYIRLWFCFFWSLRVWSLRACCVRVPCRIQWGAMLLTTSLGLNVKGKYPPSSKKISRVWNAAAGIRLDVADSDWALVALVNSL